MNKLALSASVSALLCGFVTAATAAEDTCTAPGITVLEDASGDVFPGIFADVSGETSPAGLPIDHSDILSVQVLQQAAADGTKQLVFSLNVADIGTLPALPPNATWFVSFKSPDRKLHGVRLLTDQTGAESFEHYLVDTGGLEGDGPSDGRFDVDGSAKAADASSGYGDGTIKIVVKASDVGVKEDGAELTGFNAAMVQGGTVPGVVGFADTLDSMPDDLTARKGTVALPACAATAKSGLAGAFGGSLGFSLLLPLIGLIGLRRRA